MAGKILDIFKGKEKCMCLDRVSQSLTPTTLIESGWKQFGGSKSKPEFTMYALRGSKAVPLDQWIEAEQGPVSGSTYYQSGFHVYADETELDSRGSDGSPKKSDVRRVYFRKAHTLGNQGQRTVRIAKEMYVPSDPDAWPPVN